MGIRRTYVPSLGPLTRTHDEPMTTQRGTHSVHTTGPTTRPGRLSLILLGVAVAALAAMMAAVASGQTGGETFSDNWLLATLGLVMAAWAVGAGTAAWCAIFRRRERAVLVAIPASGWAAGDILHCWRVLRAVSLGQGFPRHVQVR